MRNEFETAGDIRDVDLLAAFVRLWRGRSSGAISFSRAATSASFGLADGEIVSISSSEARFESSAILVRAGKLDAAALERLSIPEGTDGALAALQTGILTKREWRWGEKIRAIEVLADMLAWPDGKYYFDADARPVAGEFTLTIPRLLLELFLRSRDRNLIDHQLGPSDAPLLRAADFDQEFTTFGLTADAESVVRLIDGRATADEIARTAPAEEFAVRKLLAALATLGLVRAARDGGPAAPAELEAPEPLTAAEETLVLPAVEEEAVPSAGGDWEHREDFDAATRRVPSIPPEEDREADSRTADSGAPWDVPVRETGPRRTNAFAFDPPGSTSSLEAYPLPGGDREAEVEIPSRGEDAGPGFEPLPDVPADASLAEGLDAEAAPSGRGGMGPGTILALLVAGLVVAIAVVLYMRSRPVSSEVTAAMAATAPPASAQAAAAPTASAATALVPTTRPVVATGSVPTTRPAAPTARPVIARAPAAVAVPAARPTTVPPTRIARVAPVRPTAAPAPPVHASAGPGVKTEATPSGRAEWSARAGKDRRRLASERSTRYTIQLELACEVPSLAEAWKHDRPAGSMWLLETRHGSRDCFRVMWGRYPSLEAAKRAKGSVPGFFNTPSNHPAVVAVGSTSGNL